MKSDTSINVFSFLFLQLKLKYFRNTATLSWHRHRGSSVSQSWKRLGRHFSYHQIPWGLKMLFWLFPNASFCHVVEERRAHSHKSESVVQALASACGQKQRRQTINRLRHFTDLSFFTPENPVPLCLGMNLLLIQKWG